MRRSRLPWKRLYRWYELLQPHIGVAAVVTDRPAGARILALAPHIGDDVAGCGGTLSKHAQADDDVQTLYMTDCSDERITTCRQAAKTLGLTRQTFWEFTLGALAKAEDLVPRLTDLLFDARPDVVYLPSLFERDEDHLAVNRALISALAALKTPPLVYAYERRTALIPNVIVDITDTFEAKQRAMRQCEPAGLARSEAEGVIGLNRYRAVSAGGRLYAEAFYRTSAEGLRRLWTTCYGPPDR